MTVLISNAGWLLIPGGLQQTLRFIGIPLLFTIVEVHFEPQALLNMVLKEGLLQIKTALKYFEIRMNI